MNGLEWDGKHPLADKWSFWLIDKSISSVWSKCLIELGSFDTVEDFWSYFHYIEPLGNMKAGCDLCLFKKGIRPEWEDPRNAPGGRWELPVEKSSKFLNMEDYWQTVLMMLVGANLGDSNHLVTGAVVNKKDRGSRIAIWTGTSSNEGQRLSSLGVLLKRAVQCNNEQLLTFRCHQSNGHQNTAIIRV